MATVGSMAQVNVRVDRSVKERAEEALRLSGGTLPDLIKKVVAKVAQGGGQCEEVLAAVDDRRARSSVRRVVGSGGSALRGPGHRYVVRVRRSRLGRNLFRSHGRALSPKGDDPVSGAPLKIMVDANVWVDSFCVDHAESLAARAFIGRATETGALLFFPVHIAKDVLYVVQHELKRSVLASGGALDEASARAIGDAALAFVRNMTENATAVGADASDLWLADKYLALHRDYEDNLVLAACKRAQVDYLVTNDRKLLEHADLAAKTPRQMMPILALAERGDAAIG